MPIIQFDFTQEQYDRIVENFGGETYAKAWVSKKIADYIVDKECQVVMDAQWPEVEQLYITHAQIVDDLKQEILVQFGWANP